MMAYLLKKHGRYYAGSSYSNVPGYGRNGNRCSWTTDETRAYRFQDDDTQLEWLARQTRGKIIRVPSTKSELRSLGRRRMKERGAGMTNSEPAKAKQKAVFI